MMIHAAINILILSALLLIVGLWKPKLLLFWMDEPKRFPIIVMFLLLVMVGMTLFGEGSRQKQLEQETLQAKETSLKKVTTSETLEDIPSVVENKFSTDATKILAKDEKKPSSATTTSTP